VYFSVSRVLSVIPQLAMENHRLRQELSELKCQRSLLDDERVLDSIEQSFRQFNAFLDMLRDAGSVFSSPDLTNSIGVLSCSSCINSVQIRQCGLSH